MYVFRKRWHLFPPEDTSFLYPTRIPYEESSVFSSVNIVNPDLERFPRFSRVRPYVVTLSAGEVRLRFLRGLINKSLTIIVDQFHIVFLAFS